jgi:hypothetical protein
VDPYLYMWPASKRVRKGRWQCEAKWQLVLSLEFTPAHFDRAFWRSCVAPFAFSYGPSESPVRPPGGGSAVVRSGAKFTKVVANRRRCPWPRSERFCLGPGIWCHDVFIRCMPAIKYRFDAVLPGGSLGRSNLDRPGNRRVRQEDRRTFSTWSMWRAERSSTSRWFNGQTHRDGATTKETVTEWRRKQ